MTSSENPGGPGLCERCGHARSQRSAKGSEFWRCGRAESDPDWPRYPQLPVLACAGFEEGRDGEAPGDA